MARDPLAEYIKDFQAFVNRHGWSVTSEKAIAYGHQFTVSDGTTRVPVTLYTTGKVLVQGKSSQAAFQNNRCHSSRLSGLQDGWSTTDQF